MARHLLKLFFVRFVKSCIKPRRTQNRKSFNVGFGATLDCAVLIAAQELGLFDKHGLSVRLSREVGWATVREKLLHEELDAAAAPASLLFSIYCGLGVVRRACLTGLLLGMNGSAVTLSNELWNLGARDAASLGEVIRKNKGVRVFTFGMVLDLSSQNYNLRKWLISGGVDPDVDVQMMVIPSALMYDNYRSGHLDGYCVADPWNSVAALEGTGWVVATTSEIEPQHPEKVLLVLKEVAENREEEHLRMIAALMEASQFCDDRANREELAEMLAQPRYFDTDKRYLANSLVGPFESGRGRRVIDDFVMYDALKIGAPSRAKGKWVFDLVRALSPANSSPALRKDVLSKIFREDIFRSAAHIYGDSSPKYRPEKLPRWLLGDTADGKPGKPRPAKVLPRGTAEFRMQPAASCRDPNFPETSTTVCA